MERSSLGGKARAKALRPQQRAQISRAGGLARMAGMSPAERSALARLAADRRWAKRRQQG
jgi:hypothetical protein